MSVPMVAGGNNMPEADIEIMEPLVRRLLASAVADQGLAPGLAGLELRSPLHGDLHPLNLVWRDGRLAAVIDFGDITAGDPASDLAAAWYLFPQPDRRRRFQELIRIDDRPVDDATWARAAGWVLAVSCAMAANSADQPVLFELARRTLHALAADGG